jgi:predicted nucleotidyltransferase
MNGDKSPLRSRGKNGKINAGIVMTDDIKKILRELKKGLVEIYGDQLKAVYLYGSYARGDAHPPDSDIDVMIVLKGEFDYWEMDKRSSELVAALSLENDMLISTKLASETQYASSKMPLYINVRKEGIAV